MTVPLEDPVGWQVHFEHKPATQRDRVGCVLYSTLPRKTTPGRATWTPAERRVLRSAKPKLFIHTAFRDVLPDGVQPPASRPLLVEAIHHALLRAAPLILEAESDGNPGSLAAIGRLAEEQDLIVSLATKSQTVPLTAQRIRAWGRASAFTQTTIASWVEGLREAVGMRFIEQVGSSGMELSARRTFTAAVSVAADREQAGWTQAQIREYLTLYGYANGRGTVGAWHHDRYQELLHTMRAGGLQ